MRVVVQRVLNASVKVEGSICGAIGNGLLVFAGFEAEDTHEDVEWMVQKLVNLRIFKDENQLINLSVKDVDGEMLIVSQFTLFASTKKGNRPSFIRSAKPETAIPLYEQMIAQTMQHLGKSPATGIFGADMKIELLNDGPVTIIIDSKNKE
jgi:D-tyrosyl-tRNA(Tyr) deacylase